MAKLDQIHRLGFILNKLNGLRQYVPADELLDYIERKMRDRGFDSGYSLRTLQRDFKDIASLFGIEIKHMSGRGYYISEKTPENEAFAKILSDFEIQCSISADAKVHDYILPEHRRMAFTVDIGDLIASIRDRYVVEFDYTLFRQQGKVIHKVIKPHFLKESQQRWYLIGYDEDKLKTFEIGRIANFKVCNERFKRNSGIDVPALFRESFGIWNNPDDPVDRIELRFDALDAQFIKTLPLHATQKIVAEDENGITVQLKLRITNDFVMALLSRSRSVEVLEPQSLRKRLYEVYKEALRRNSV